MTEKTIAIVGAGFAGLAACWFLQQNPQYRITLYDAVGIGSGASATSAGLVHPFTGPEARVPLNGLEAFALSRDLIQQVATENPQVIASRGILRVALTERQEQSFRERSEQYPGLLRMLTETDCQTLIPGLVSAPGLWVADGLVIDSQKYLQGLWAMCEEYGAVLRREAISDLSQLSSYDAIVVACGFSSVRFPELAPLLIRGMKGQIIELQWPQQLKPLSVPLNSDVYIVPARGGDSCIIGATFERGFTSEQTDAALAEAELRPKAEALIPALRGAALLNCRAGVRATTPGRQPFVGHVQGRIFALTALGAKGLLYHAFLAQQLVRDMLRC